MKHLFFISIFILFAVNASEILSAQNINILWFDASLQYNPGSGVSIVANPTDTFSVNNKFTLELSDVGGTWIQPTALKEVTEFYMPVFNATLPTTLSEGKYKMRIRSSNPVSVEETPSFEVKAGTAPRIPMLSSTLINNTTYFNCQDNNIGGLVFGSLNKEVGATTLSMNAAQRLVKINDYISDNSYNVVLYDVLNNNQITLSHSGYSITLPDNLPLGTYVLQVIHTQSASSVFGAEFLYHGNGTNLGNSSSEEICANNSVYFGVDTSLSGIGRNYAGSKYIVNFGDGSPATTYTQRQLLSNPLIAHVFTRASCSETGSSFQVNIQLYNKGVANSCGAYKKNGTGVKKYINVSVPPKADFLAPANACINNVLTLTNNTLPGYYGRSNCKEGSNFYWYYQKPGETTYTLVTDETWVDANGNLKLPASIVNVAGCWKIKVEAQNQDLCQSISLSEKLVMVEAVAQATFSISTDSICINNTVTCINTSNVLNQSCSAPKYTWLVEPANAQNANGYNFVTNLDDAEIKFIKPGLYNVKLKIENACGSVFSQGVPIYVAGSASVTLPVDSVTTCIYKNSTFNVDFNQTNLKPVYNSNYGIIKGYKWTISGDNVTYNDYTFMNNTDASSAYPVIDFKPSKKYQVVVEVQSECFTSITDTILVHVYETPEVNTADSTQTICSGTSFRKIDLGNANYRWTAKLSKNLTQIELDGAGRIIEGQVLVNNSDSVGVAIFSVFPVNGICTGSEFIYKVFVKPSLRAYVDGDKDFCLGSEMAELKIVCKNGVAPYTLSYIVDNGSLQQATSQFANDTVVVKVATSKVGIQNFQIVGIDDTYFSTCNNIKADTIAVEVVDNPIITEQPQANQVVCVGAEIDSLRIVCASNSNTQKIQWYVNSANNTMTGSAIVEANTLVYKPATFSSKGDYYFYAVITLNASDCGMAVSNVAHIQVVGDPVIVKQENTLQSVCKSSILKPLSVEAEGGAGVTSYKWYVTTDTIKGNLKVAESAFDASYIPQSDVAGEFYYFCEVNQTSKGCSTMSKVFKVEIFDTPVISKQPASQIVCKSEPSYSLSAEYIGGSKLVSYQWFENTTKSNVGGVAITNGTANILTQKTTNYGKYYYYCVLTFGTQGCATTTTNVAEINVIRAPELSNQFVEVISGNEFTMIPVVGASDYLPENTLYSWTVTTLPAGSPLIGMVSQIDALAKVSGKIANNTDTIASVLYMVTPEVNGCSGNPFSLNVVVLPALKVTVKKQDILCYEDNNGQLEATIIGGQRFANGNPYIVSWRGPNGFESSNLRITNLTAGDYTLSVQDASGVEIINKYIIERPEKLKIETEKFNEINCSGVNSASIQVNISGGKGKYSFNWTKNNTPFATTEDLTGLSKGNYMLNVTDENGCVATSKIYQISEFEPIVVNVLEQKNNTCFGSVEGSIRLKVSGGTKFEDSTSGYIFSWTGINSFKSDSINISNLVSGTYQLVVTDKNGCSTTMQFNITQPTEILITPYVMPSSCSGKNDASITLDVTGGKSPYQIEWSNYATGFSQQNLSPGTYTARVSDANGCQKLIAIEVVDNSQLKLIPTVRQISCNGANNGSIKLSVESNRTGIKVKWLDGSKAGVERNNLAPGVYAVEVSDGGPCVLTNSFVISEPAKMYVSSKIKNSFACETGASGAIEINVIGGTAPYTYLWSNNQTTKNISDLLPGKYFVTITDSLGCTTTESFELLRHDPLQVIVTSKIAYSTTELKFKEICTAKVSGGLAPYKYEWSTGTIVSADSSVIESFVNQTVSLKVVDALGCSAMYYFKTNIPEINIQSSVVDCNGQVYRFEIKTPASVSATAVYSWDFGDGTSSTAKTPTHIFLQPGDFVVKLKIESNDAVLNFETNMKVEATPTLKLDREPRFCKNDSVELIVSGADTYIWNDGTRGNRKVIKKEGTYSVLGTSVNACSSTLSFTAQHYDYKNYTISTDKNVLTLNDPTLNVWTEETNQTKYIWQFGDSSTDEGNYVNHTYEINSPVTMKVKLNVVNPYGCVETAEKIVWLIMEEIPNIFTPNNDGSNDRFLKSAKLQVFNSNGIIIYEGIDGWDGTYKGKQVAMDTYYYVVYYATPEGIVNKPGFVFLAK